MAAGGAHAATQRGSVKKAPVAKLASSKSVAVKAGKSTQVAKAVPAKAGKHAQIRGGARLAAVKMRPHAAAAVVSRAMPAMTAEVDHDGNPLLHSAAFMIADQATGNVILEKNSDAVLPIASITKLMTAMVVLDARLGLNDLLTIVQDDVDTLRGSSSHVPVGTELSREDMLRLALMSSENRAAQLLGRTYPGGLEAFVEAMNAKARILDMSDSHFADPTGLSPENRSSANDLVKLVKAAYEHDVIRAHSISGELALPVGKRMVRYGNTNCLTANPNWDIGLQKTGYISAAGRCIVMQAVVEGQRIVMVLLDSVGKYSRIGDAQRIRDWLESKHGNQGPAPAAKPIASAATADKPI